MAPCWLYCGWTSKPDVCRSLAATPSASSASWTRPMDRLAASSAALTEEAAADTSSASPSSSGVPDAVPVPVTVTVDGGAEAKAGAAGKTPTTPSAATSEARRDSELAGAMLYQLSDTSP